MCWNSTWKLGKIYIKFGSIGFIFYSFWGFCLIFSVFFFFFFANAQLKCKLSNFTSGTNEKNVLIHHCFFTLIYLFIYLSLQWDQVNLLYNNRNVPNDTVSVLNKNLLQRKDFICSRLGDENFKNAMNHVHWHKYTYNQYKRSFDPEYVEAKSVQAYTMVALDNPLTKIKWYFYIEFIVFIFFC